MGHINVCLYESKSRRAILVVLVLVDIVIVAKNRDGLTFGKSTTEASRLGFFSDLMGAKKKKINFFLKNGANGHFQM